MRSSPRAHDCIRALLVDDEPAAHLGMRALLADHSDVEVIGEACDGPDAVRGIQELRPDVVFLDVEMPGFDGFDVLRAVGPAALPAAIFVTAYDDFAVRAFEVRAIDYLLKPVAPERLAEAVDRLRDTRDNARGTLEQRLQDLLDDVSAARAARASGNQTDGCLLVRVGPRDIVVPIESIDWIEADDYCVVLHVNGTRHVMRQTLALLHARLPTDHFVRIHRSAVVNLRRITSIERDRLGGVFVVVSDGARLPVSRGRRPELLRRLGPAR